MAMIPGDRVRLLHSNDEGVLVKFLSETMAEVAVDNDFNIPVLITELVPISSDEAKYVAPLPEPPKVISAFTDPLKKAAPTAPFSNKGIFIGLENQAGGIRFHLINNTDLTVYFGFFAKSRPTDLQWLGLESGGVSPKSSKSIYYRNLEDFDVWPVFKMEWITFANEYHLHPSPNSKELKITTAMITKTPVDFKHGNAKGTLVELD